MFISAILYQKSHSQLRENWSGIVFMGKNCVELLSHRDGSSRKVELLSVG